MGIEPEILKRRIQLSFSVLLSILIVLLMGLFSLTTLNSVFRRLQRRDLKKEFINVGKLFFYRPIHLFFFPDHEFETLFFASTFTQNMLRFFYAILSLFLLIQGHFLTFSDNTPLSSTSIFFDWTTGILYLVGLFLVFFVIGDYLPRVFGIRYPNWAMKLCILPASLFMLITLPISFLFLKISRFFVPTIYFDHLTGPHAEAKQEIIDMIQEADVSTHLDIHDKQLFESVMTFKDRIAREVMVPRVDIFSLSYETSIEEAASLILSEGYSRTPVYKNNLDNIIGVLMYKDLLAKYVEYAAQENDKELLKTPIAPLVKNVLYTPETKKISHLLQEFRKKQVHLAIIVNEYGGTEGIVTIEDILEEIVGDIADEYDEEEPLYIPLPSGGWLVDSRMGILDIEEQLGIEIPQDGDYDTIGGYVFHETGMIPSKGYLIQKPLFEIEILRSNDRRVEKVRIQPVLKTDSEENFPNPEE